MEMHVCWQNLISSLDLSTDNPVVKFALNDKYNKRSEKKIV